MQLTREALSRAVQAGVLSDEQAKKLWVYLTESAFEPEIAAETPKFSFTYVLYYFGGMILIGALSLFMTLGSSAFGGRGMCLIAVAYGVAAVVGTEYLLFQKRLPVPAGILATLCVVVTPMAVYGLQEALGYWHNSMSYRDYHYYVDWRWVVMELATLPVAAILLWRYPLPFLVMPVAVTLWYLSMDLAPLIYGTAEGWSASWDHQVQVSLLFGLAMLLFAFLVDLRNHRGQDYAFWLYLYGAITFWGALTSSRGGNEFTKFGYCLVNVALIFIGPILGRRVFVILGGLGVTGYLGHLSYTVFQDSLLFPLALSLLGLGIVALGIYWQKYEELLTKRLRSVLPTQLRELLEARES